MVSFWNPKSHSKTSMRSENEIQYEDWEWDWEKQTAALLFCFFSWHLWQLYCCDLSSQEKPPAPCPQQFKVLVIVAMLDHVYFCMYQKRVHTERGIPGVIPLPCWCKYKQYCKFYFQVTSKSTLTSMQHTTPPSPSKETWPSPTDHYLSHTPPTAVRHPSHVS